MIICYVMPFHKILCLMPNISHSILAHLYFKPITHNNIMTSLSEIWPTEDPLINNKCLPQGHVDIDPWSRYCLEFLFNFIKRCLFSIINIWTPRSGLSWCVWARGVLEVCVILVELLKQKQNLFKKIEALKLYLLYIT